MCSGRKLTRVDVASARTARTGLRYQGSRRGAPSIGVHRDPRASAHQVVALGVRLRFG